MKDPLEKCSDNELYELYLKGKKEAMEIIVQRNTPRLYSFFYRMVPERETSRELVQETFLKLVRARPDFSTGTKLMTYLYSIARNLAIDEIRKRKHRKFVSLDQEIGDDDDRKFRDRFPDKSLPADDKAIHSQFKEKIESALSLLPPEQREVFLLRELEGLSFVEIARITGCSENTIKSRMRYALEKLRDELKDFL